MSTLDLITKPLRADKGEFQGACNRQACQAPDAVYFNRSTRAYYCKACALRINEANGETLCTLVTVIPKPLLSDETYIALRAQYEFSRVYSPYSPAVAVWIEREGDESDFAEVLLYPNGSVSLNRGTSAKYDGMEYTLAALRFHAEQKEADEKEPDDMGADYADTLDGEGSH